MAKKAKPEAPNLDEEANRKAFEAVLADPAHDHPAHPGKPIAVDEEGHASPPPWAGNPDHPGPKGWHRQPDPDSPEGFVWMADEEEKA